jgi:hypothetical protein
MQITRFGRQKGQHPASLSRPGSDLVWRCFAGLYWLFLLISAPCKGDEIRDPVALQGEVPPSDLFGLAMLSNESPLERA